MTFVEAEPYLSGFEDGDTIQWDVKGTSDATFSIVTSDSLMLIAKETGTFQKTGSHVVSTAEGSGFYMSLGAGEGTLTVNSFTCTPATAAGPAITTQPQSQSGYFGETFLLKVVATDATGYQWQFRRKGQTSEIDWSNLGGDSDKSDTFEYTQFNLANDELQFRVILFGAGGTSVKSEAATVALTLGPAPQIATQPADQAVAVGETATFEVEATGATRYKWEYTLNGGASWFDIPSYPFVAGADSKKLTITPPNTEAFEGYQARVTVYGAFGTTPVVSNTVSMDVSDPQASGPKITTQPEDASIDADETATFHVTATGAAPLSYQWYVLTSSAGSWSIVPEDAVGAGTTSDTLTIKPSAISAPSDPVAFNGFKFRVVVTDANGNVTSDAATLAVTAGPTVAISPAAGVLPGGTIGQFYQQQFTVSGIAGAYKFVLGGDNPPGMNLNETTGLFSGTPTAVYPFKPKVIVIDRDNNTVLGNFAYTWNVQQAGVDFVFSPVAGSLTDAMEQEEYSQQITATGGTGVLTYTVIGTLPAGMELDENGKLTGKPAAGSKGSYPFTVKVTDGDDVTGTTDYTLKVVERAVSAPNKLVEVPAGSSPLNINLETGATGGPFTSAAVAFVQPANAGTATIVNGEFAQSGGPTPLGWYLKFIPNPAFSGRAVVGYTLTNGNFATTVVTASGTVTYILGYHAGEVAADIDDKVHGFVETRQGLIANGIHVPGLLERRRMEKASGAVTARMTPSEDGITANISTSLVQMEAARDRADGIEGAAASPFNIWIDGTFLAHKREQNDGRWGSFGLVSLGADYLLSEKALVGLSFHFDRMTDPTKDDAELTGNGWLAGPYASLEIGENVFWNASLLYGGSANDIDSAFWDGNFDTTRWMIDNSITGQWRLDDVTTLTPTLRAVYFSEKVDGYAVNNSAGDELGIDGFTEQQFRVSLGAEIARSFTLENDAVLTPRFGLTGGISGLDGSGAFGTVKAGLSLETPDAWMIDASLLFNLAGEGEQSGGAKVGLGRKF